MPFDNLDNINVGCGRTFSWGPMPVWTKGSTTTLNFHPITDWMLAAEVEQVRASIELMASSGSISVAAGYQTANNPDSPDAVTASNELSSYRTTNGYEWTQSFTDVSTTTKAKQYVRFGVIAKNTSGTLKESGQTWTRFDIDPR